MVPLTPFRLRQRPLSTRGYSAPRAPGGHLDRAGEIDGQALERLVAQHLRVWVAYSRVLVGGVNARIDDLSARMDRIETRLDGFDERLRNVEIAFGKVDQHLLTIERVVLPGPDADE